MSQRAKLRLALAALLLTGIVVAVRLTLAGKQPGPADVDRQQEAVLRSMPQDEPPQALPPPNPEPSDTARRPRKAP